ncbi:hypothetical protein AAMO2058_001638400 [Amorphochlora amoebiformis]
MVVLTIATFVWAALVAVTSALGCTIALILLSRLYRKRAVGFFHPYAECRGGGERVLFLCIRSLQEIDRNIEIVVYTGCRDLTGSEIINSAQKHFNIAPFPAPEKIKFVRLSLRPLVDPKMYPRLTLLGQSIGSMFLGLEAILRAPTTVFIDTTGFAFTYPVAYLAGCRIACYTHYPTVSMDMISVVKSGKETFNNKSDIAKTPFLSHLKVLYYRLFAWVYGMAGRYASLVMVNSTWTRNHIVSLWQVPKRTHIVFPPCDTRTLERIPLRGKTRRKSDMIVSIGQFRPEKNHAIQLRALSLLIQKLARSESKESSGPRGVSESKGGSKRRGVSESKGGSETREVSESKGGSEPRGVSESKGNGVRLVMVGACRNEGDRSRVRDLKRLANELGVTDHVTFAVDISFKDLQNYLAKASLGLHTMRDEHFGICVVEYMAAGVIPIAHASGGPMMDIVIQYEGKKIGFLAETVEEYAKALYSGLRLSAEEGESMRYLGRKRVNEFSNEKFVSRFATLISKFGLLETL